MIKILVKVIKVIGLLAGALLLVFIVANLKDDELRPEVKEALNWQVPVDAFDKENGYVLLHGMFAPIGQDPYLAGKAIIENNIARYQELKRANVELAFVEHQVSNPFLQWSDKQCIYVDTQNCIDFYLKENSNNLNALIEASKPQAARFNALKASKKFIEVNTPMITNLLPPYEPIAQITETERVFALQEISLGKLEAGVNRLVESNQFSRRSLANSGTLITHMIAIAMIQKDTRLMSELLTKYPEITRYKNQIQSILNPISSTEYSLKRAFDSERQLQISIVDTISYAMSQEKFSIETVLSRTLMSAQWLPNSTQNLFYDWASMRTELVAVDANKLKQKVEEIALKKTRLLGLGHEYFYIRNPVGKILVSVGEPAYINYIEHHHDLDGYLTLVRLQHKLIADKVNKDQVAQTLPNFPNPYSLEPMRVDTQNGLIIFEGRQPSNSNFNKSSSYQIPMPQ